MGDNFTIPEVYDALVRRDCVACGAFGGFFFLPTASRVCFTCIRTSHHLCVRDLSTFGHLAGLSAAQLQRTLGHIMFRTIDTKGSYSFSVSPFLHRPMFLIAERPAVAILKALQIIRPAREAALKKHEVIDELVFMASVAMPWYDLKHDVVEIGVNCTGCQAWFERQTLRWSYEEETFASDNEDSEYSTDDEELAESQAFHEFIANIPQAIGLESSTQESGNIQERGCGSLPVANTKATQESSNAAPVPPPLPTTSSS